MEPSWFGTQEKPLRGSIKAVRCLPDGLFSCLHSREEVSKDWLTGEELCSPSHEAESAVVSLSFREIRTHFTHGGEIRALS